MRKVYLFLISIFFIISCKSNSFTKNNKHPQPVFGEEFVLKDTSEESFTFCVIPDTQKYFHQAYQNDRYKNFPMNQYEIAYRQMEWIVKNS